MSTPTSNQTHFVSKATTALNAIGNEWIKESALPVKEFVKKYYRSKQENLDERTNKFSNKMMEAVKQSILGFRNYATRSLEISLEKPGDDNASLTCLNQLALPHLLRLKQELDAISPTIVDDVISS